jgi:biopolymer transport protein ExbD
MRLQRNWEFRLELFHVMPVVNVVFLALLLFSLGTRFSLQPGLTLSLPVSTFTLSPLSDPLVVTITAAPVPTVYFREQRVTLQELDVLLQNKQLAGRLVVVRADSGTPYERVAEISNAA